MNPALDSALKDVWQHLTSDRQAWLLGAGASFHSGVPLMHPLTIYVTALVSEQHAAHADLWSAVRDQLPDSCHVEHILSQLGDLIALAQRSKGSRVVLGGQEVAVDKLRDLHNAILSCIGIAIRYGYRPASNDQPEKRGTPDAPIVSVDDHRAFVRQLFASRAKPGFHQIPISFFTTNYDTLTEDALALEQVPFIDGFVGGAMAYWAPDQAYGDAKASRCRAKVFKLHGSVDWHLIDDGSVIRCRDGCGYPSRKDNLMIHPQSTKYVATQKDPFASLFGYFREALATEPDNVLGVCGYSFSDDHVDGEIESAMGHSSSKTVIVAFSEEREVAGGNAQLPARLRDWLSARAWRDRVFVASNRGLYHGSLENLCPSVARLKWWTFQGLTAYLADGPDVIPAVSAEQAATIETGNSENAGV